ncbi:hypothetical protein HPP92_023348 [Vanilla planifolia]|uniref:Uncharacterized protein n=1 Tax=Vanilla planifolia TaxID=51239 RepID=A0A835PTM8_VANPL|nr:hypothetical protein HPP92_023348 [Vanilla planifolia]
MSSPTTSILVKVGVKGLMISFILICFLLTLILMPSLFAKSVFTATPALNRHMHFPVTFAYLLSASKGDVHSLNRTLTALYHPANQYLLHLDFKATPEEHSLLSHIVLSNPVFTQFGNVKIVEKPNLVTYRGPTMLAATLHGMAILLRCCRWDWFINLSASDYPVVTQDDLIVAFSNLPRNLNFIQHSRLLGWKIKKRARPIIIDPGLYSINESEIIWSSEQRSLPTAFKLFTGSAWTIISRSFAEYMVLGWENLPRTLLIFYTNFISSAEGYFQTVVCNSEYKNTTVNHDLHYITWDNPPKQHPLYLGLKDYRRMILSSAPFARKFKKNDPVLDKIDREILRRHKGQFTYGGWCLVGKSRSCSGGVEGVKRFSLRPGAGSRRLKALLSKMLSDKYFRRRQCK